MAHLEDCAAQIVGEIIADLSDRRGLKHEWNRIDDDVQQEIKESWTAIVINHLKLCQVKK